MRQKKNETKTKQNEKGRVRGGREFVNGTAHKEAGGERSREVKWYGKGATKGSSREVRGGTVHGTQGGDAWRGPCAE